MATAKLWEFRYRRCLDGAYPATSYPLPKRLLILLAVLPFTAVAQPGSGPESDLESPGILLSNADEVPAGWTESILAQGFITGHSPDGYRLGGIDLFLERPPAAVPGRSVVALHADDMGEPGERVVVFTNPESYAAGANRFATPFPIVLDPRKAYHLLVNLGADPPLAFGLVFPGKADVASADARWVAQTGSRTLLDNWEWRFNSGFALRVVLLEAGDDVPPPAPSSTSAVAPVVDSADESSATDETVAAAAGAPPESELPSGAATAAEAAPAPSPAEPDVVAAIAETSGSASVPVPTPAPAAPTQARAATESRTTTAQPPTQRPQPQEEADDDDDEVAAPLPRSNRRTGLLIGAALAGLAVVSSSDDDDAPAPVETTPPPPPPPLSDVATLSALSVSDNEGVAVSLTPMFSPTATGYEASVAHAVAAVTIMPTTSHAEAELGFLDANDMPLGDADTETTGFQANLLVGTNTVKVKVTAENGEAMQTYSVAIDRAMPPLSDDATLSALAVTDAARIAVPLTPTFAPDVTAYSGSVEHSVATVTIVPTTSHANAVFAFLDGSDMPLADGDGGTAEFQVNLVVGTNTVKVKVTAENGEAMQTYSVAIDRAMPPLSDDATLSALAVTDAAGIAVPLTPGFASGVTAYSGSVEHSVATVTIVPTTSHANAVFAFLDGSDMPLADGDGGTAEFQVNLLVGTNTVKVKVTAENGEAMQTYTVALDRAMPPLSDDAMLSALAVTDAARIAVPLTPNFASGVTAYTGSVEHSVATVTIVPTTSHANAVFAFLDGSDMPLADGDGGTAEFQLNLVVGTNTVKVKVTAENGEAMQTYSVAIDRAVRPLSDDATLSALAVTDAARIAVPLTPSFASGVTAYSGSVEHSVATVTILPMKSHASASVEFLDGMDMSLADADTGTADFQFDLDVGQNTVKVKVTAENGVAMQTHTLTLTRAIAPPQQVLTIRVVPAPEALIAFWQASSDADGYRLQWKSGEEDYERGGEREVIISDGATEIYRILDLLMGVEYTLRLIPTKVGAADGLPSNEATGTPYARAVSVDGGSGGGNGGGNDDGDDGDDGGSDGDSEPEAWLADLEVFDPDGDEVALSPPFSTPTASYGASVANDVAWVTFKPTKNDPVSVVVYEDGSNQTLTDADAVRGDFQVNLNVGANVVKVRVSHPEAQSQGTYTVTITRAAADDVNNNEDNNQGDSNNAPEFPASTATRDFDENIGDATSSGIDLGAPIAASDDDSDTLTYTLEGADEADFLIDPSTGQLSTRSGTNYSYETQTSFSVTVKADDSNGGTDTIAVTIDLNDLDEKPLKPDAPGVSAVSDRWTRLTVSWSAPDNTGRPSIASYDLQYKKSTETDQDWKDGPQNVSATTANLDDLEGSTAYDVQVRATNADGDGPWSDSGSGTTSDAPPEIESNATRSFDEDVGDGTRSGVDVGAPVTASDHGANHSYTLSGTDAGSFSIASTTGQIRTLSGANYNYEAQSSYSVIVDSDDGNSGTEAILVTINVNDVTEKPTKPAAPMVDNIAGNTRVIYVTWTAPSNTGRPQILSYDLQYREAPSGAWFDGPQDETGFTASISGLSPSTEYDVQVRATNADGDGPWSDDGSATTSAALPATCLMSENGNSRLADGFTPKEGRVEVCA